MNPNFWLPPLLILLLGFLWFRMPHLTRPDIFFAITVKPSFRKTPEAIDILRKYNVQIFVHTAIAFAVVVACNFLHTEKLYALAFGWQVAGPMLALKFANGRTRPFAAEPSREFEVDLSPNREPLPGGMVAFAIPFAILAASAAILYMNWEQIPQNYPIHWGFDGKPNRWVERTPRTVYGFLVIGALTCLSMVVMASVTLRSRRISVSGEQGHNERQFRRLNLWTLLAAEYLVAFASGGLPILTTLGGTMAGPQFTVLTLVFTVVTAALLIRQGQGGSRLSPVSSSPRPAGDRTPDDCWKWGLFYVNPDDPALFVEKRFGLGYTVNLGNPWSWVLVPAILAVPLGAILLR